MERCEPTQRFNNHKGFTFFSDEPHHKGLVHLPLSESFEAESGAFQQQSRAQPTMGLGAPERLSTTIRSTTHNGIGGSRTATSDHQGSQPPRGHLGSKDPRVTSSQDFNFHESSWRAHRCTKCKRQEHKAQILHTQIPPQATNAYGGEERKNKGRTPNPSKI